MVFLVHSVDVTSERGVTQLLGAVDKGDSNAAAELLALVYSDLRKLANKKLGNENPGQTLQATALVHEAYIRLVGQTPDRRWDHRGHFFASAAEAMRRILVDNARRKRSQKRGGELDRQNVDADLVACAPAMDPGEVLAIHEALDKLAEKSPRRAELVKLRYFLGCTIEEAAETLGIPPSTAEKDWTFARAWLKRECQLGEPSS